MVQYNRDNPAATQAIRQIEQAPANRTQELREFEDRRKREQQAALDKAMREPLQKPSQPSGSALSRVTPVAPSQPPAQPTAPAAAPTVQQPTAAPGVVDQQIANLAQVPGGGQQASTMFMNQQASRKKQEDQVWELLKEGTVKNQPDLIRHAKQQAQQLGLDIPPSFFDDPEVRTEMVRVISAAKDAGMNEKQIGTVVATYLQNNPALAARVQQSFQAGRGYPEALQAGQNLAIQQDKTKDLRSKGGATMHLVDRISKEFNVPWSQAYEIYNTSKSDPQKMIINLYNKALQDRTKNMLEPGDPGYETDEQIQARVTKAVRDIYGSNVPNISDRHTKPTNDPLGILGDQPPTGPVPNGRGMLNGS